MIHAETTITRKKTEVLAAILLCSTEKQSIDGYHTLLTTAEYEQTRSLFTTAELSAFT